MAIENKDFIEIDFSAKVKNGEIFDTTRKEDSKVLNVKEDSLKPLIISVGNEMVVKGLDSDLIGKEIGKDYEIEISPENAFGKRDASLVQMIPMKNFNEQKISPQKGMQFSFDGKLARILSVSGGRVLVDFNNLLAGKEIVYNYKILKKVEDKKEQFDALQDFFFRKKFECEIKDKKINVKVDKEFSPLFELMKKRFEDILGLEISVELVEKKA
jgi:FKBP-type peptidyl-prolyl cis-trans isomerase 2